MKFFFFFVMLLLSACGAEPNLSQPNATPLRQGGDSINNGEGIFQNRSQRQWDWEIIPQQTRRWYHWSPLVARPDIDA